MIKNNRASSKVEVILGSENRWGIFTVSQIEEESKDMFSKVIFTLKTINSMNYP